MSDTQNAGAGAADSVGGAVHPDAGASNGVEQTQDEPVLEQNNASIQEKLDGIAAQTRVDLADDSHERYVEVLKQRPTDSQIELAEEEVTALARRAHPSGGV